MDYRCKNFFKIRLKSLLILLNLVPLVCVGVPSKEVLAVEYWVKRSDPQCSVCKNRSSAWTTDWTVQLSFKDSEDGEKKAPFECMYVECESCHHIDLFRVTPAEVLEDE